MSDDVDYVTPEQYEAMKAEGGGVPGKPKLTNPYGSLMPRPPATDPGVSKWTLENDDVIERLIHYLRREFKDPKTKEWVSLGEPLCNEKLIAEVITIYDAHANKNIILSDLSEDKINELTWNVVVELCGAIYVNGLDYYGLKKETDKDVIVEFVYANVYCALRRAWEGRERRSRQTWMRVEEIQKTDTHSSQQGKGIMSMFPSFKSK